MKMLFPTLLIALLSSLAIAGPVRDHRVVAELIPETDAIVPGKTLTVCLHIKHDPKWHTYWKNPGLAGVPTKLEWDLPDGFKAGPIQWARPQRVKMAIYNTFGYEDDVTLLIDIETPDDLRPGDEVVLKAKTVWMMCADTCHPSSAKLSVVVPITAKARPHPVGKKLADATRATMPVKNTEWQTQATLGKETATLILTRKVKAGSDPEPESLYFFCDQGLIDSHPEQTITRERPGVFKMVLPLAEFRPKDAKALSGVLLVRSGRDSKALSLEVEFEPQSE